MDRLLALSGGQPLRSNDWSFIQDSNAETIKSIVKGLMGTSGYCIVSGLVVMIGDEVITVTEGYLFKDDEIFYVPGATFTDHGELYSLYLTPNTTTGESRTFKDSSTHDVYEYRRCVIGYASSIPSGSIGFPGSNLLSLISQHVLTQVPAAPAQLLKFTSVTYAASVLNAAQVLVPAPGAGKAIKVISVAAWISPTTTLNVGVQDLNVIYVGDESSASIGLFPNSFVESSVAKMRDMTPSPDDILVNQAVKVQFSSGASPTSGAASIKFHCFYVVITL